MIIKKKKLSDIIPADYNPRTITDKALLGLENSITEFGLVQPLVWNKRTKRLIGGHQRLKVLQRQGFVDTEVIEVDLDETKEKALNITLNNQKIQGEFDYEKLKELLDEIKLQDDNLFEELSLNEFVFEAGKDDDFECEENKINLHSIFEIIIECESEQKQEQAYNLIKELGLKCRLSTL